MTIRRSSRFSDKKPVLENSGEDGAWYGCINDGSGDGGGTSDVVLGRPMLSKLCPMLPNESSFVSGSEPSSIDIDCEGDRERVTPENKPLSADTANVWGFGEGACEREDWEDIEAAQFWSGVIKG